MKVDADLVETLRSARRERKKITQLKEEWKSLSEEAAYDTMFAVTNQLDWKHTGWKIAATNRQMQLQLRTDTPVFGPTFGEHFLTSPAIISHEVLLSPIVECEFFFKIGESLPSRQTPYCFNDVLEAIERVHVGIEIAECRFPDEQLPPKELIIADGFASGWYVIGEEIKAWREAFERDIGVTLLKNNKVKAHGLSSDVMGHPVAPIVWLANKLNSTGRKLARDQIVSSGTCNILARARKGDVFKAVYDQSFEINVEFK